MRATMLVDALKRELRAKGLTYAQVARGLRSSEASVKRWFSRRDFTLQRLEDVCRRRDTPVGAARVSRSTKTRGASA